MFSHGILLIKWDDLCIYTLSIVPSAENYLNIGQCFFLLVLFKLDLNFDTKQNKTKKSVVDVSDTLKCEIHQVKLFFKPSLMPSLNSVSQGSGCFKMMPQVFSLASFFFHWELTLNFRAGRTFFCSPLYLFCSAMS